ncbi:MAG TPA: hypothetical protein VH186_22315 [Chloroflexia bacterium]|nr:hypothetical protein [Chloroflexia bacterium]
MNSNPFSFDYVFNVPDYVWGFYSTIYFIVFLIGTLVFNFIYFYGKYRFKDNLLTYTLINRASRNASIAFSLGFFFFLCRIVKLQPFAARIFLDAALVLLLYYVIRGIGYMFRTYPKAKAEWEAQKERTQRKAEPRIRPAAPAGTVAKTVPTGALASSSADAGGDEAISATQDAKQVQVRQGLSERGMKRRERKRNKR